MWGILREDQFLFHCTSFGLNYSPQIMTSSATTHKTIEYLGGVNIWHLHCWFVPAFSSLSGTLACLRPGWNLSLYSSQNPPCSEPAQQRQSRQNQKKKRKDDNKQCANNLAMCCETQTANDYIGFGTMWIKEKSWLCLLVRASLYHLLLQTIGPEVYCGKIK